MDAADKGAPDLARFVNSFDSSKNTTISTHSYGSIVGAFAIMDYGATPDNFVLLGSPGVTTDNASPFSGSTDVFVGASEQDWMISGPRSAPDWIYGRGPEEADWGGCKFDVSGVTDHGQYYSEGTESLKNIRRIVRGQGVACM